mmetsp:Transcript_85588/g.173668  ORF Transcript_85588/g.173668 Transcript_85588/m.173668 type:complete len:200 (-) Transcript_85588:408-1007(-)
MRSRLRSPYPIPSRSSRQRIHHVPNQDRTMRSTSIGWQDPRDGHARRVGSFRRKTRFSLRGGILRRIVCQLRNDQGTTTVGNRLLEQGSSPATSFFESRKTPKRSNLYFRIRAARNQGYRGGVRVRASEYSIPTIRLSILFGLSRGSSPERCRTSGRTNLFHLFVLDKECRKFRTLPKPLQRTRGELAGDPEGNYQYSD